MSGYVVAVDVGNSRIKLGVLERGVAGELPRCLRWEAVPHDVGACTGALSALAQAFETEQLTGIVAGVNPRGVELVLASWPPSRWDEPRLVDDPSRLPIDMQVDEPARVGIDRVLNAVAVNVVRPSNQPAIVIDCGTATTVDAVAANGAFAGGAILPGFELAARALYQHTARLPQLSMEELAAPPEPVIGRDTRAAIRSGLAWGQLGAVRELIGRMSGELLAPSGQPRPAAAPVDVRSADRAAPLLFLSGGGGPRLAPHLPQARYEPHLALQGLAVVVFAGEPAAAGRAGGRP